VDRRSRFEDYRNADSRGFDDRRYDDREATVETVMVLSGASGVRITASSSLVVVVFAVEATFVVMADHRVQTCQMVDCGQNRTWTSVESVGRPPRPF